MALAPKLNGCQDVLQGGAKACNLARNLLKLQPISAQYAKVRAFLVNRLLPFRGAAEAFGVRVNHL